MSAFLAALCLFASPVPAQDLDHWDARVVSVQGEVLVQPADGGDQVAAEVGMPLEQGDRVTTSEGASAELSLNGESLLALRENSDFTLEETETSQSSFLLSVGSLLAKIEALGVRNMRIRTPTAVAAVRGTELGVEVDTEDQTHVGVFDEGHVDVRGESGGVETLSPHQETSVRRGQAPAKACALKRFLRRREQMFRHCRKVATVRRRWQALSHEKRRELRQKVVERLRQRRQEIRQKREENQERLRQKEEHRRQEIKARKELRLKAREKKKGKKPEKKEGEE